MPEYVYRCNACSHEYEIHQRITAKPIKLCPSCKKKECERLICEPIVIDCGPLTVGGQADRNTRNMGHYELEAKREETKKSNKSANNEFAKRITGGKDVSPATEKPFYHTNNVSAKKINSMNPAQVHKFIKEGKTP